MYMAQRDLSVVVYGATGFTGRLIASYLATRGGVGRIGLAGRRREALEAVAAETARPGWEPEVLVAAADDEAALSALAARARVVISAAGPYTLCGTPLVAACVASGTDYVDINGEVPWVRGLIDRFDAEAARSDVRIVPCCGYSVPTDLGTLATVEALRRRHGEDARSVHSFMFFNGRLSGGTMATGIVLDTAAEEVQAQRRDPFLLGGAPPGGARPEDDEPSGAQFEERLGVWTAPFWMSSIDSRVVRRSHALFREQQQQQPPPPPPQGAVGGYGAQFGFRECALARDEGVARGMAAPMAAVERRQKMIARGKLPGPGEGPSAEVRARSWFRLFLLGESEGGRRLLTSVGGGDPGYDVTSKAVAEAALLLAHRREELPHRRRFGAHGGAGGVLTPAFALGLPLLDELTSRGIVEVGEANEGDDLAALVRDGIARPPRCSLAAGLELD